MNKKEFIDAVAIKTGYTKKDTAAAIDGVFDVISDAYVAGEEVKIQGFGTFLTVDRPARNGQNPSTGEPMVIPAGRNVRFKPSKTLKAKVNE